MLIIDRFEGDYAVVDTGLGTVNIPRTELPANAKEGDALRFVVDGNTTAARKKNIDDRMNRLFKD